MFSAENVEEVTAFMLSFSGVKDTEYLQLFFR